MSLQLFPNLCNFQQFPASPVDLGENLGALGCDLVASCKLHGLENLTSGNLKWKGTRRTPNIQTSNLIPFRAQNHDIAAIGKTYNQLHRICLSLFAWHMHILFTLCQLCQKRKDLLDSLMPSILVFHLWRQTAKLDADFFIEKSHDAFRSFLIRQRLVEVLF